MPMPIRHQRRGLAASLLRVPQRTVCTKVLARNYGKFLAPLNAKKARGLDILNDPLWNKGTAFTIAERDRLGIKGLLPPVVKSIEQQRDGFLQTMREKDDPVEKNLMLRALHDRN